MKRERRGADKKIKKLKKGIDILGNPVIIAFVSCAGVAELADAQASGACGSNIVWVQVPSPAFFIAIWRISSMRYRLEFQSA